MERLTYWCDDGMGGGEYRANENGSEYSGPSIDRLAAYEDTGLEPAEIEIANKVIVSAFNLVAKSGTDMLIERLKEIICAEAENRLLVPPCKVGDMVFYIRGQHIIGDTVQRIVLDEISGQVIVDANHCYLFSDVGKNVFRTREEAEEALKEREGDG